MQEQGKRVQFTGKIITRHPSHRLCSDDSSKKYLLAPSARRSLPFAFTRCGSYLFPSYSLSQPRLGELQLG